MIENACEGGVSMTTLDILDRLQKDALRDRELRKHLLATRSEKDPLTVFCCLCRSFGYELYEMDLISAGEDFNALNFQNDIILLTKYSQVYLKLEWERVKYEIRGEKDLTAEQIQANEISLLKEKYYHEYLKQERNN